MAEFQDYLSDNQDFANNLLSSINKGDLLQQSDYDGWIGTAFDYPSSHQEVYDRLCHFNYLINQDISGGSSSNRMVQDNPWLVDWLVKYAGVWGNFCNSPDLISPETIYSFYNNSKDFNVTDYMIPINEEGRTNSPSAYTIFNEEGLPMRPNGPFGWMSWNQMFARELNPGLCPIDSPTKNTVLCYPADCTFKATHPISMENQVLADGPNKIERTHSIRSIDKLLKDSKYANAFCGETYVHYFLGPYSYHRFHTPVDGEVKECKAIPGLAYLDVNIKDK